jgi:hypothetical protein
MDAYFPVFDNLTPADKAALLNAATMDEQYIGNYDFMLNELVTLKQKSSKSVLRNIAAGLRARVLWSDRSTNYLPAVLLVSAIG